MNDSETTRRNQCDDGTPPPLNDTSALNGGDAWHWFIPGGRDRSRTPMLRRKVIVASVFWAILAVGLLMLASSL
jgi:hypothetical protein